MDLASAAAAKVPPRTTTSSAPRPHTCPAETACAHGGRAGARRFHNDRVGRRWPRSILEVFFSQICFRRFKQRSGRHFFLQLLPKKIQSNRLLCVYSATFLFISSLIIVEYSALIFCYDLKNKCLALKPRLLLSFLEIDWSSGQARDILKNWSTDNNIMFFGQ